jgi:phosphocarrier protein FPr
MEINTNIEILAPLSGLFLALKDVPDPVFAQKMVGDGYAIEPTSNKLTSPFNGTVIQIHSSKHAITIEQENGCQVLMHIGIDTVKLNGEGFKTFVNVGDKVKEGETLIEFDLDFLAIHAKSLITPVLVLNSENNKIKSTNIFGQNIKSGQHLFKTSSNAVSTSNKIPIDFIYSEKISLGNPAGMHARPSAEFVTLAKTFTCSINLTKGQKTINGKSLVGILSLEVDYNEVITIGASGSDAKEALIELSEFILNHKEVHSEEARAFSTNKSKNLDKKEDHYFGVPASEGKAIGTVFQIALLDIKIPPHTSTVNKELPILEDALNVAKKALNELAITVEKKSGAANAKIFYAHLELLEDPDILLIATELISKNKNAAYAWHTAYTQVAKTLSELHNSNLAARATDIKDVGLRVLKEIVPIDNNFSSFDKLPNGTILVAPDLTPSETARLDRNKIVGFATTCGGSTSHVAIIARSLGIPAIVGTDQEVLHLQNNQVVLLDAENGFLKTNLTNDEIEKVQQENIKREEDNKQAISQSKLPAITLDGVNIEVAANITNVEDATNANNLGCDGVGLFRSEFIFMEATQEPSIEKQTKVYQSTLDEISRTKSNPLIIRTLDVGGDKPLSYLPITQEENPFLGERGIRVSLENESIFRNQIKAILNVKPLKHIHIMFPMVSILCELLQAKKIVREEQDIIGVENVSIGIMVEVPSTALMADAFAPHVDFFSIGANDLTQYTLAIDRGHSKLAKNADGLNPAVLKLIKMTCEAAQKSDIWVGVCGGIASDLQAIPILLGLGVTELSVSIPMIPKVKAKVREINLEQCKKLAFTAMNSTSAKEVRKLK